MPNDKVLKEKQAIVEELAERFANSSAGVFVDYKGINVEQDTMLRREMRENNVDYTVVKNTLTRFAVQKSGLDEVSEILNGTTSVATVTGDPIAPFRIISERAKKLNGILTIKAAFLNGKVLSDNEIREISEIPSMDSLHAKVLGTMLAPITSLAVVLGQILEQKGGSAVTASAEE